jgi:ribosome-binding protein aMBF1 (putative translation factor)
MGGLTILGIVLAAVSSTPQKCELCGNPIKKANYTFTHEGKSMTICVNCNRRIESKKSKEAVDALFNKGK